MFSHTISAIALNLPIPCVGVLHIRILWICQIKNVIYLAFRKFHLHGDVERQSL